MTCIFCDAFQRRCYLQNNACTTHNWKATCTRRPSSKQANAFVSIVIKAEDTFQSLRTTERPACISKPWNTLSASWSLVAEIRGLYKSCETRSLGCSLLTGRGHKCFAAIPTWKRMLYDNDRCVLFFFCRFISVFWCKDFLVQVSRNRVYIYMHLKLYPLCEMQYPIGRIKKQSVATMS